MRIESSQDRPGAVTAKWFALRFGQERNNQPGSSTRLGSEEVVVLWSYEVGVTVPVLLAALTETVMLIW